MLIGGYFITRADHQIENELLSTVFTVLLRFCSCLIPLHVSSFSLPARLLPEAEAGRPG